MSIQYMALGFEPMTLEHESPTITTRPGLPPSGIDCWLQKLVKDKTTTQVGKYP